MDYKVKLDRHATKTYRCEECGKKIRQIVYTNDQGERFCSYKCLTAAEKYLDHVCGFLGI